MENVFWGKLFTVGNVDWFGLSDLISEAEKVDIGREEAVGCW